MSRTIQLLLVSLMFTLLAACSNDDDSKVAPANGTVTFFHNVENASVLQLNAVNTTSRNSYGTVDFQLFSDPVFLSAVSWGLEVVDNKDTLTVADDVTVLEGVSFSVTSNRNRLVVLTGDYTTPEDVDLQLHEIPVGYDPDFLGDDSHLQYLTVGHVHKDLGVNVDVYLIPVADYTGTVAGHLPQVTDLAFGATSDTVVLDNVDPFYYMILTETGTTTELFNSGEVELKDYLQQALLLSPNYAGVGSSAVTVFYYGNSSGTAWQDQSGFVGSMRAYNAVTDSVDLDVMADNGDAGDVNNPYQLLDNTAFGDLSPAFVADMTANSNTYSVIAYNDSDGTNTPIRSIFADIWAAEQWTVIFYGRTTDTRAMRVLEDFNASTTRASVTVSNAAYFADADDIKAFDVYVKKSTESLASIEPAFAAMRPGSYGHNRFVGGDYQILVTEAGTDVSVYPFPPLNKTLVNGTNYHYLIVEDPINGGYQLQLIHESP